MAQGRDWRKTLRPASFKGVPFQTERDDEAGGRRIVSHQFAMRDDPFNEDLGEALREFEVVAYLASNQADSEASDLAAVCAERGPGLLVLPMQGGVMVRLTKFRRSRERDRAGYVAFTLSVVREGASVALISIAALANLIFVAVDRVSSVANAFLASAINAVGMPVFVADAAREAIVDGAAILEAVRIGEVVDPAVSAVQRVAIASIADAAPGQISTSAGYVGSAGADLIAVARALGGGLPPAIAINAFAEIMDGAVVTVSGPYVSAPAEKAADNRRNVYLIIRLAAACAYCEAIAQADIPDRPTAIALRAGVAERFEELFRDMPASEADLYREAVDLQGSTIEYLSRAILDRAPIVEVGANRRMPSLWWAHRLYADAERASELVERNSVAHPSFMPVAFEAALS